jgi:hypothetical protein
MKEEEGREQEQDVCEKTEHAKENKIKFKNKKNKIKTYSTKKNKQIYPCLHSYLKPY